MSKFLPTLSIEVPNGEAIFTRAFLDGVELRGVTRVRFDTGDVGNANYRNLAHVTIDLIAEVAFEGSGVDLETVVRSHERPRMALVDPIICGPDIIHAGPHATSGTR